MTVKSAIRRAKSLRRMRKERDAAQEVCAEAYQVVGVLADEAGRFDEESVQKALDNLAAFRPVHDDVLPFPRAD